MARNLPDGIDIRCCDCLSPEGLPSLAKGSVDLVVVDPPYGIDHQTNRRKVKRLLSQDGIQNDGANNTPVLSAAAKHLYRVMRDNSHLYWFTREDRLEIHRPLLDAAGFAVRRTIVWDKGLHGSGDLEDDYAPQWEAIIFAVKGRRGFNAVQGITRHPDILRFSKVPANNLRHNHEKPLPLVEFLILKSSNPGDLVVDPFLGSGTTADACYRLNRRCIGMELNPNYIAIAKRRLSQLRLPV